MSGLVLGIAGVGLIGGSIAAAARDRGVSSRIIGFGRSGQRLRAARDQGLIDEFSTGEELYQQVNFFVSCLPIDGIAESVGRAGRLMPAGSIATDAGSTKRQLCETIGPSPSRNTTYIGSHPLAGSEKNGFEYADASLFEGRVCVITPAGIEPPEAITKVAEFWSALGSRVITLAAEEHDRILARTSHVPHVAAAVVAGGLDGSDLPFASGGFRDATRIAAGDPALWTSILLSNQDAVGAGLDGIIERCEQFRQALRDGDSELLNSLLSEAKKQRDAFDESS